MGLRAAGDDDDLGTARSDSLFYAVLESEACRRAGSILFWRGLCRGKKTAVPIPAAGEHSLTDFCCHDRSDYLT